MRCDRVARTQRPRVGWTRPCQWAPRRHFTLTLFWGCNRVELCYHPGRGYYARRMWKAGTLPVNGVYFPPPECLMKRRVVSSAAPSPGVASHLAAIESVMLTPVPNIVAHLAVTRYDDGTPRQPGWLTVRTEGVSWKVIAKDPDGQCSLTAIAQSVDDALALMDLMLGAEDAPWEPDRWMMDKKPGGRKKT